jgi:hypothetical protein
VAEEGSIFAVNFKVTPDSTRAVQIIWNRVADAELSIRIDLNTSCDHVRLLLLAPVRVGILVLSSGLWWTLGDPSSNLASGVGAAVFVAQEDSTSLSWCLCWFDVESILATPCRRRYGQ